jgi:hypothetical protein
MMSNANYFSFNNKTSKEEKSCEETHNPLKNDKAEVEKVAIIKQSDAKVDEVKEENTEDNENSDQEDDFKQDYINGYI